MRLRRTTNITPPTEDELRDTARHEAGHAVMALSLGCRVDFAIVRRNGDGLVVASQGRGKRDPFVLALISWAGPVAEGKAGIQVDDLAVMKRVGLRPPSIGTLRRLVFEYVASRLALPIAAVAELLLSRVGRRVPGADLRAAALAAAPWIAEVKAIDAERCRYCARVMDGSVRAEKCPDREARPCASGRKGQAA